jgi:adenine phosphoribosyltransferase
MAPEPHNLKAFIRDVPDFPKAGIVFKDIMPLLACPLAFRSAVNQIAAKFASKPIDAIAAAEARGFLFAAPVALTLGVGIVPIRKPGKLPHKTVSQSYALEYGTDQLEVHADALQPGMRVLLVDDVLATGGTMRACCDLVVRTGAEVAACAFLIELVHLGGRPKLEPYQVESVIAY